MKKLTLIAALVVVMLSGCNKTELEQCYECTSTGQSGISLSWEGCYTEDEITNIESSGKTKCVKLN